MSKASWEIFFEKQIRSLIIPESKILDIGAGLRVDAEKGNVVSSQRMWILPLLKEATYHVMDPVDTYHPDIVGDVMKIPLPDASYDVVVCLAVLEHVPRPWDAMHEMIRLLKPGGSILLYVPFFVSLSCYATLLRRLFSIYRRGYSKHVRRVGMLRMSGAGTG